MHIAHPNVISPVYELIKVVEFDVELGDDQFNLRVELFRSVSDACSFRAHLWRTEFYRMQSTFPQDGTSKEPVHPPSDELVLIDHSHYLAGDYSEYQAEDQHAALQMILDDYRSFLTRTTGQDR